MAKMTLQEKLAAARAGGPATPTEPEAAPVPEPEAEAVAEEAPSAAPPPAPRAVAPAPTGKKLSLKEKLAAARAGGPPPAAAEAPPSAVEVPEPAEVEAEPAAAAPAPPAVSVPTGRPLTLKEKLAAARGGAAPAAAPAAGKPAAAKAPAAAKPAAAKADRPLPPLEKATDPRDLAEHLRRAGAEREKAARADEPTKAAAAKAPSRKAAEAKVVPPRPDRDAALSESRRGFLSGSALVAWIVAGWAALAAGLGAFTIMSLRFMFPNVLAEPPSTIKVGLPSNFELGEVNETWKAEWGFWIVRSDAYSGGDTLYALSTICTHLGCPPNWLAGEQKFKCPCHGSGFYVSGVNFEGPAPRPLERYKVSVGDDGQIVVDKSQKFQEELGQWSDPDSFIPMA